MSRQTLRDRNQHVIGYIDVEFSGRQCLRDSNNHVLGYYEPSRKHTYHTIIKTPCLTHVQLAVKPAVCWPDTSVLPFV